MKNFEFEGKKWHHLAQFPNCVLWNPSIAVYYHLFVCTGKESNQISLRKKRLNKIKCLFL